GDGEKGKRKGKKGSNRFSGNRKIGSTPFSPLFPQAELRGHEEDLVGGLADALLQRFALTVARLAIDRQQNRPFARVTRGRGLERRGHFTRMQGVHAAVV